MRKTILATSVAALLLSASIGAQDAPPPPPPADAPAADAQAATPQASGAAEAPADNPRMAQARQLVDSLNMQSGDIPIPEAKAHLHLGDGFRYLSKPDARKVLEQLWGNPPDDKIIGMVVPVDVSLLSKGSWATVVTHVDEGHVPDADAAKTDYDKLLAQMKEQSQEDNEQRRKAGYGEINLIGWAAPPHYDEQGKKLYWARELADPKQGVNYVNYDIRVLGRTGYLSLNAVGNMDYLPAVQSGMQRLLPMVEFDPGQRYADFNAGTDKTAEYGIAALILGGVAAKAGLFAKLGVILLAAKKFIILAFAAVGAWFKKMFGAKDKNKPEPPAP